MAERESDLRDEARRSLSIRPRRVGGRGHAWRTLRGQRRLAAAGGADLQPADGNEAAGAGARASDGAAQAAALSDFSHAGKTGPPRAPHAAAAGSQLEPVFQLAVRTALVTFARALLKPGVETIFASFHPTTETPSRPCCLENGPRFSARPLPAPWPTLIPSRSPVRLLPPPSTVSSHLLRTDYGLDA